MGKQPVTEPFLIEKLNEAKVHFERALIVNIRSLMIYIPI